MGAEQHKKAGGEAPLVPASGAHFDYTQLPGAMETAFGAADPEGAVRPTIINAGQEWTRTSQASLLSAPAKSTLPVEVRIEEDLLFEFVSHVLPPHHLQLQGNERKKAFDLLDGLTRSGILPIPDGVSLHVVVAATHCFAKTVMDTVVQENINPLERIERSSLVVTSTVHQVPPQQLVGPADAPRIAQLNAQLLH